MQKNWDSIFKVRVTVRAYNSLKKEKKKVVFNIYIYKKKINSQLMSLL